MKRNKAKFDVEARPMEGPAMPSVPLVLAASPLRDLDHKGGLHVDLATVDDGAVSERTIMLIGSLKLYGVDHSLGREKPTCCHL